MKKILPKSIKALLLAALITCFSLILGCLLGAAYLPSTQVYDVRVTVRTGNCSNSQTYTVEARSNSEARRMAASAALNSTRVSINGVSIKR